jgi:hypothetical protein
MRSKTLGLNALSLEDFADLMHYTGKASLALTDMFCALIKLLLADTSVSAKLAAAIPRKVSYAYRSHQGELDLVPTAEVDFNLAELQQQDDYDCEYNGLKLLPRKLRVEAVDALNYQAVLRSIILRLEPVKQLRRAVLDVSSVMHFTYTSAPNAGDIKEEEVESLLGLASAFKRQRTRTPAVPKYFTEEPATASATAAPTTAAKPSASGTDSEQQQQQQPPQTAQKVLTAAAMTAINTPKVARSSKHQQEKQRTKGLDKDAIFQITSDVSAPLTLVYEAAQLLETKELHQLHATHKITLLKVLCSNCYETQRVKQLLNRNAEERTIQIQNMNKQLKEQKTKQKEVSGTKRDAAFQACRKNNIAAAEIEAARLAEIAKAKAANASKKKKKAAPAAAAAPASGSKGGKGGKGSAEEKGDSKAAGPAKTELRGTWGGKDGLDPTQDQLNAMIESMVLLESLGIDVVEDVAMDAPTEEEEEAEERENGGEDEEDDTEYEYDARGNPVPRNKRMRRVTSQARARILDKKRTNAERRQRQVAIQVAESRLAHALDTGSERDMRSAVKHAERAGCRGVNDDGKTYCTTILMQVPQRISISFVLATSCV